MREIKITNINNYIENILTTNNELVKSPINLTLFFRGQNNKEYSLIPSLARGGHYESIIKYERNLIEMAKYRLPSVFNDTESPLNLLAQLQHYGIPTRLLDVTTNPLVALYFACANSNNVDGEVIIFVEKQYDIATYPIINAIADSYRHASTTFTYISDFYKSIINQPYFLEQKVNVDNKDIDQEVNWIINCCESPLFVRSKELSIRQKIQQGSYILFPNSINDMGQEEEVIPIFEQKMEEIKKDDKAIIERYIIPAENKEDILNQLSMLGISKGTLFSDNIDIICEEITNNINSLNYK